MIPTAWFLTVKVMAAGGDFYKCSTPGGLPASGTLGRVCLGVSSVVPAAGGPYLMLPVPWFLVVGGWGPFDLLVAVVSTFWFPCMASARSPLQLARG